MDFFIVFMTATKAANWTITKNGRRLDPIYQILVHFRNFEEELDRNQHNELNLKRFALLLFPFLVECYKVDKQSLEAFSSHYYYSSGDWHTGQKREVSL